MKDPITITKEKKLEKLVCDFNGGDCALVIYEKQEDIHFHTHDFDELVIVTSGNALHIADEEEYPLVRGDVFVIHGNHKHSFLNSHNFHVANLIYKKGFFENLKDEFYDLPGFQALFINEPRYRKNIKFKSKLHLSGHQLNEINKYIHIFENEKKKNRIGFTKVQKRLFELIIIEICRYYSETNIAGSKDLLNISVAMDYMENNYTQPATINFLAKKACMSESNFRHKFKKIIGLSPIDFLIQLRIEKATEIIANNPDFNVTEVAMRTGFENSAYFSRQFKKTAGITPINYIKKQRIIMKQNSVEIAGKQRGNS